MHDQWLTLRYTLPTTAQKPLGDVIARRFSVAAETSALSHELV
jgi:hypothetical protein